MKLKNIKNIVSKQISTVMNPMQKEDWEGITEKVNAVNHLRLGEEVGKMEVYVQ
jgi:hypothetical protein